MSQFVQHRYKSSLLKHALKPASLSEKISFRVDNTGLLCIQYMIKVDEHKSFLEFLCTPDDSSVAD